MDLFFVGKVDEGQHDLTNYQTVRSFDCLLDALSELIYQDVDVLVVDELQIKDVFEELKILMYLGVKAMLFINKTTVDGRKVLCLM